MPVSADREGGDDIAYVVESKISSGHQDRQMWQIWIGGGIYLGGGMTKGVLLEREFGKEVRIQLIRVIVVTLDLAMVFTLFDTGLAE